MDPLTVAVGGLAVAIAAHGVMWFFKTPRQEAEEIMNRMTEAEREHRKLEVDFIRSSVSLGVKVDQLGVEVSGLTIAVKELTRRMDNGSARHPGRTNRSDPEA
jgi:hypothetical protein